MYQFYIFTDGACRERYFGGYAYILFNLQNKTLVEFADSRAPTSNNRMELMAVIEALKRVPKKSKVAVFADSTYVVHAFTEGWLKRWKENGFLRRANADLWRELDRLVDKRRVTFVWIRGHAGNVFNFRCDQMAGCAAERYIVARPGENQLTDEEFAGLYRDFTALLPKDKRKRKRNKKK